MRKLSSITLDERRYIRKRRTMALAGCVLLLIASPILYESALVVAAGWQGLYGSVPNVNTPILDGLKDAYQGSSGDARAWVRGVFNATPWKTSYVIPFAIFWTGVLAMLLRRC